MSLLKKKLTLTIVNMSELNKLRVIFCNMPSKTPDLKGAIFTRWDALSLN